MGYYYYLEYVLMMIYIVETSYFITKSIKIATVNFFVFTRLYIILF